MSGFFALLITCEVLTSLPWCSSPWEAAMEVPDRAFSVWLARAFSLMEKKRAGWYTSIFSSRRGLPTLKLAVTIWSSVLGRTVSLLCIFTWLKECCDWLAMSAVGGGLGRRAMHATYLSWALSLFQLRRDNLEDVSGRWLKTQEQAQCRCHRNCSTWAMRGFKVTFSEFIILAPFSHTEGIWAWRLVHHGSCVSYISWFYFSSALLRLELLPFGLRSGLRPLHQLFPEYCIP